MVYRLEMDISFSSEQDMVNVLNLIEDYKAKASAESRQSPAIMILQQCRYHKCYHDEVKPTPCGDYRYLDFAGVKQTHVIGELDSIKEV
jgi:hypothetical protein